MSKSFSIQVTGEQVYSAIFTLEKRISTGEKNRSGQML